jgi:tight adherence protein B
LVKVGDRVDPIALAAAIFVMLTVIMLFRLFYVSASPRKSGNVVNRLENIVNRTPVSPIMVSALKGTEKGALPGLGSMLTGKDWARKVELDLARADLSLHPSEYLMLRLVVALVGFALIAVIARGGVMGIGSGAVAGLIGFLLPKFFVGQRIKSRTAKFDGQLIEALSLVSNALRSGFGFLQSLDLAADQVKDPLAGEFKRTINDINVGASFEDALLALNQRVQSKDLDIVITAILIQRTVGGNLAEILETVAHTMRERSRIQGELKTLTAQQKMSGYIVGGLPIFVIGILLLLGQATGDTYIATLFTEPAGRIALIAAAMLEGIGIMIIRKILAIEV